MGDLIDQRFREKDEGSRGVRGLIKAALAWLASQGWEGVVKLGQAAKGAVQWILSLSPRSQEIRAKAEVRIKEVEAERDIEIERLREKGATDRARVGERKHDREVRLDALNAVLKRLQEMKDLGIDIELEQLPSVDGRTVRRKLKDDGGVDRESEAEGES